MTALANTHDSHGGTPRLEFGDLPDSPVFAQALDNQWMPAEVTLRRQTDRPWAEAEDADAATSAELRRALVNSGTLLVNRAFLFNTPALQRNYAPGAAAEDREALADLLDQRALVPYLLHERSATERPLFDVDDTVFEAWCRLVEQVRPACVRHSWDDERNSGFVKRTSGLFTERLSRIHEIDPHLLSQGLGLTLEEAADLRRTLLRRIAGFAGADHGAGGVTRNAVYQRFLSREGSPTHLRLLREGEHVVAAKHLVDLVYNTTVPTLSGANAHTPPQSPPRSVLQELEGRGASPETDPEEIAALLHAFRGVYADTLQRALDGPNSYSELSLAGIVRLRGTEEWRAYTEAMGQLTATGFRQGALPAPEAFAERTRAVARAHAVMLRTARKVALPGSPASRPRSIVVDLVLQTPGQTLTVLSEDNLVLAGAGVTMAAAPLVARLVFRDRFSKAHRSLSHSVTFPALRLGKAQSDLDDIVRLFRERAGRVGVDQTVPEQPSDRQVGGGR